MRCSADTEGVEAQHGTSANRLAVVLALLAGTLWGTIGVAGKTLLAANWSPLCIVLWRVIVASLLGQVMIIRENRGYKPPSVPVAFFIHGLIGTALTQTLYMAAISRIGTGTTVTLHYGWPVFAVVLGWLFFGERVSTVLAFALAVVVLGAALVSSGVGLVNVRMDALGIAMALGSGLTFAVNGAMSKYELLCKETTRLEVVVWPLTLSTLPLAVVAGFRGEFIPSTVGVEQVIAVLYLAVIPTFLAYTCYTSALRKIPGGRVAILATVEPLVAVISGALLFDERMAPVQLVGLVLILSGVLVASRVGSRHERSEASAR